MEVVYVLWHSYEDDTHEDSKLIGVYKTKELADQARAKIVLQSGFRDWPDGFIVDEYELNTDHWEEGFGV